jgi:hypothetical protein
MGFGLPLCFNPFGHAVTIVASVPQALGSGYLMTNRVLPNKYFSDNPLPSLAVGGSRDDGSHVFFQLLTLLALFLDQAA